MGWSPACLPEEEGPMYPNTRGWFSALTSSSRFPTAVPTPESPGRCLRLQVSVCCKESGEWAGVPRTALEPAWEGGNRNIRPEGSGQRVKA